MVSRNSTWALAGVLGALAIMGTIAAAPRIAPSRAAAPAAQSIGVRHGWLPANAKKMKLTYVSDYTESLILVYEQGQESAGPVGEIETGISSPQGIAVDGAGTLYVANQGNNTITEYPAGASNPMVTLSTGISSPLDVAVGKDGTLYVTQGSADQILEFAPSGSAPEETISITHPSDVAVAKNSDAYATNNLHFSSAGGEVAVCKPGKSKCKELRISLGYSQGIAIDSQGDLVVGDYIHEVIDIFAPGASMPTRTIPLTYQEPGKLALDATDANLYMCDPADFAVDIYNYATGAKETTFTYGPSDELEGVALYPGVKPVKP